MARRLKGRCDCSDNKEKGERKKIKEYRRVTLIADGIKIFTTVLVERKVIVTESNYGI